MTNTVFFRWVLSVTLKEDMDDNVAKYDGKQLYCFPPLCICDVLLLFEK